MLAYGRQKPAYSHFVARIFRKILAEHLTHFIRKLLYPVTRSVSVYATVRARQAGQDVLIHVRVDGGAGRPARQPAVRGGIPNSCLWQRCDGCVGRP